MPLNPEDVRRIAHLARLSLSGEEETLMLSQLNGFFGIVERMAAVDTSGVEPLYTPLAAIGDVTLRLREDKITEEVDLEAHLRNAPSSADGLFLVPKVIE